jgi:hypothetical protein
MITFPNTYPSQTLSQTGTYNRKRAAQHPKTPVSLFRLWPSLFASRPLFLPSQSGSWAIGQSGKSSDGATTWNARARQGSSVRFGSVQSSPVRQPIHPCMQTQDSHQPGSSLPATRFRPDGLQTLTLLRSSSTGRKGEPCFGDDSTPPPRYYRVATYPKVYNDVDCGEFGPELCSCPLCQRREGDRRSAYQIFAPGCGSSVHG